MAEQDDYPQLLEGVSQANLAVLGSGPALSLAQAQLTASQTLSAMLTNMVHGQHQQQMANSAAITQGVCQLHGSGKQNDSTTQALQQEVKMLRKELREATKNAEQKIVF